jgi:fructosamine-3-kinase
MRTFTKSSDNNPGEAAGLRWLGEAQAAGGARIARVVAVDDQKLEIEHIDSARPSADAARRFGAALAHTHAAGAEWWGCPPDNWSGPAWVGNSKTPLVTRANDAPRTWGEFYARYRIAAYADRIFDRGLISQSEAQVFERLEQRLCAGDFDVPQPELLGSAGYAVARVHGDMWTGNVLYDGGETGAALIDPMAHGGHAETDLATLSVFGFPYLEEVYAGYDAESKLAPGWQERIGLHQLGIVIMHSYLFQGGYTQEALELAGRYV